ncbi:V-type ATPase subunit [Hyperthermus butylicus]|uniref:Uncharacterized protein n=1 Tax=Hyperthermus butylicus (strain DSM 5456 / JCM 9403 / PLM1-5) TaxID=415426 RepID=A2BJJ5_HYPBU|nr:V-type ATPase subunit [Hyperthermus butylicus]ABM80156.1 hypothetical protein Hbut_0284 [Hyperthermus butylicus DSM 5456]
MNRIPDVGVDYLNVKAFTARLLSLEDDLKALMAQYTGDEAVLELFQATKLSKYLPEKPANPRPVEVAAYRYMAELLGRFEAIASGKAEAIHRAYKLVLLVHDAEIIIGRMLRGKTPPRDEELVQPASPQVGLLRRLAEEEAKPSQALRAVGLEKAAAIVEKNPEYLSTALDLELIAALAEALQVAETEYAREIIGARLDITAVRIASTLAVLEAPSETSQLYFENLRTYRLPADSLRQAIETKDAEQLETILKAKAPQQLPENLPPADAYIAAARKHNRKLVAKTYIAAVLTVDVLAAALEQALLDAEDAIIIAIAGYSKQPKQQAAALLSIQV